MSKINKKEIIKKLVKIQLRANEVSEEVYKHYTISSESIDKEMENLDDIVEIICNLANINNNKKIGNLLIVGDIKKLEKLLDIELQRKGE